MLARPYRFASPLLPLVMLMTAQAADAPKSIHEITVKTIDGQDVTLGQFKGKVLLVVNTASQCGYTSQYAGMQSVYEKYKDQGFEVLAFPANEFGGQEPGSNDEIKTFCMSRYHTTFPLFAKIVVAGQEKHPLYRHLTDKATNPSYSGEIPWNFTKFLVDRNGQVIGRFEPKSAPESPAVTQAIEAALASK